jgi:endonuclease YncB( thermonuclease family)
MDCLRRATLTFLIAWLLSLSACSSNTTTVNRNLRGPSRPVASSSSPLTGTVTRIVDGDTIDLVDDNSTPHRVRLQSIDAPEFRQAFGKASRLNLETLISGRRVSVEWHKVDQHNRIVGKILLDAHDICLEQVKAGLAWHYKQFEDEQSEVDRKLYDEAEQKARAEHLGLWQDVSPLAPWEFRHNGNSDKANAKTDTANSIPPSQGTAGAIWGNRRSMIYHWPGCPNYYDIARSNRVPFDTREAAERAGYRPARNCP